MIPLVSGVRARASTTTSASGEDIVELSDRHGAGGAGHRVGPAADHGGLDPEGGQLLEQGPR